MALDRAGAGSEQEIISINIGNGIKEYQGSILIYVNLNTSEIFYHFHIIDF